MENLQIKVSKRTRMIDLPRQFISVEGENLQSKLIFSFVDEFVDGQARLEYNIKGNKNFIVLDKQNESYITEVKNILTIAGQIDMQLVITETANEEGVPVFKSNKFYLYCNSSINAVEDAPDGYELWIEHANAILNEFEDKIGILKTDGSGTKYLSDDGTYKYVKGGTGGTSGQDGYSPTAKVETTSTGATITITDKNGTTTAHITNGKDGVDGAKGEQGIQGVQGIQGEKGDKGDTGSTGPQGPQGPQGPKGDTGDTGSAGKDGTNGVGISSVKQTTTSAADGGTNVITVTKTDGTTSTFSVKNGSKGSTGEKGDKGATGDAGYTPVKGTDYYTEADKNEIVNLVIEALPNANGVSF